MSEQQNKEGGKQPEITHMVHPNGFVCGFTVALALALTTGYAAGLDDVDYRQNIMKTLGEQAGAVGMILEQKAPQGDLTKHVKALAITSTQVLKAFEPHAEGGDAKPNVWKNWDKFAAKANEQAKKFAELDKALESGGLDAAAKVKESFACKSCHDTYRVEK